MVEKNTYSKQVKEDSLKVVSELLESGEELEFYITGANVDAIYARAAMVGAGMYTYGATYAAGYPTAESVEYTSIYFTNKAIVVLNCNKHLEAVSNLKINYTDIRVTNLYKTDMILEIVKLEENSDSIAVEFGKEVLEKYIDKIKEKLMIIELDEKYSSGSKKAYDVAVGGSGLFGAVMGALTLKDILKR
ncbi:MAG: hypothetical protein ACRDA5_00780 [Clostridium sp.]